MSKIAEPNELPRRNGENIFNVHYRIKVAIIWVGIITSFFYIRYAEGAKHLNYPIHEAWVLLGNVTFMLYIEQKLYTEFFLTDIWARVLLVEDQHVSTEPTRWFPFSVGIYSSKKSYRWCLN